MRCSRFVAFLLALVTGALGVGLSLLVLTEVPRDIKEISACVSSVKIVAHQSRGRRGRSWTSYDLWLDARDQSRGFVHDLNMFWPDKALAEKIRPGDCVVMSVDGAKLDGRDAVPDTLAFVFDWVDRELAAYDLEMTWDSSGGRVKILTLEKGPNQLIGYLDSLLFSLGLLGGLAVMFLGATLALLWGVVRGPTVGDLEPVSFISPEGYSLSLGTDCLTYREQGRTLKLPALQEIRPERIIVYTGGGAAWAAPHEHDPLTPGHFDRILDRIEIWFSEDDRNYTLDPKPGFDFAEA